MAGARGRAWNGLRAESPWESSVYRAAGAAAHARAGLTPIVLAVGDAHDVAIVRALEERTRGTVVAVAQEAAAWVARGNPATAVVVVCAGTTGPWDWFSGVRDACPRAPLFVFGDRAGGAPVDAMFVDQVDPAAFIASALARMTARLNALESCNLDWTLSPRELELVFRRWNGLSKHRVGALMGVDRRTVSAMRSNIRNKLAMDETLGTSGEAVETALRALDAAYLSGSWTR